MALFWFHVTLISTAVLLAFGMAALVVYLAESGKGAEGRWLALVPATVGAALVIYLWLFLRRRGAWKR